MRHFPLFIILRYEVRNRLRSRKCRLRNSTYTPYLQNSSDTEDEIAARDKKRNYNHKKTWTCKKCDQTFELAKQLRVHRKSHRKEISETHTYKFDQIQEIYVCNTCCAEYQEKDEIDIHMKTHYAVFVCAVCPETFQKAYNYSVHMATHSEDKLLKCPYCTAYTTTKRNALIIHINYVHLRKFYYHCKTCGKGFNDVALFKEHDNEHLGVRPFVCIVCNSSFTYSKYLWTHQVRNHSVRIEGQFLPNQCTLCYKVYSKSSTLEKHFLEKHTQVNLPHAKTHLCDLCGKSFARKNKLDVHYRVHTGEKPYGCSYCTKSFTRREYLVLHERIHSGEKPYSCEYCGKCFNQGAPLKVHRRTHSGERPFVCVICNSGFTSRGGLNLHLKSCSAKS